jgi:hypothetical protein
MEGAYPPSTQFGGGIPCCAIHGGCIHGQGCAYPAGGGGGASSRGGIVVSTLDTTFRERRCRFCFGAEEPSPALGTPSSESHRSYKHGGSEITDTFKQTPLIETVLN